MIPFDDINKSFETLNLSLMDILIVSLAIMSLAFIGISLFIHKGGNLFSRLGALYFGVFLFVLASFLAALNGYIPL